MKTKLFITLCLYLSLASFMLLHKEDRYTSIQNGNSLFDQHNDEVNAHGACIIKEGDRYYLFGEYKSDTSNAFIGFGCYSSVDLMNWKFENIVLAVQKEGILGPNRVGERVKVMKCPTTKEFVMYMHCDDMKYNDPHVGYATCKTINGDYQFQGDLLHNEAYLRKWDLGTFQDNNGKGYLLTHEGYIYELSSDYKSIKRVVVSNIAKGGESPALFKSNGYYFWLFSNKTSWERNDNYYFVSTSLEGPWAYKGLFAPEGSLTWNSQCSFVLSVTNSNDTLNMYMGDRWSYPKQGSAATYVWLPITVKSDEISIPEFHENWNINVSDCKWKPANPETKPIKNNQITCRGNWNKTNGRFMSKEKGALISYSFKGKQTGIKGLSNNTSGYARIVIRNNKNKEVINTIIDFYSKYEYSSLKFMSPLLEPDEYTLSIEVLAEHPSWSNKRYAHYGSTDNYIIIEEVFFR